MTASDLKNKKTRGKPRHSKRGASVKRGLTPGGMYYRGLFHPLLLLALAFGLALRIISMHQTDFGYDEIMQARVIQEGLSGVAGVAKSHFGASPLDYYLCWIVHRLVGTDASLRFPALFWGVLSILLSWRVGRRFGGRREAIALAWLIAFSPMLVFASHLVRWYSGLVFFSLAIPLTADLFLRRPKARRGILFGISLALGFLEHPFVLFPAFAWFAATLVSLVYKKTMGENKSRVFLKKRVRTFIRLCGIAIVSTIPYAFWAVYAGVGKGSPFTPPDWGLELFSRPFFFFSGGKGWLVPVTLLLLVLGIASLFRKRFSRGLFLVLLLLTWPLLIAVSISRSYIFYARHLIYLLPWILLGVACGIRCVSLLVGRIIPRMSSRILFPILLVIYLIPLIGKAPERDWDFGEPLPFKIMTRIIRENIRPDTYFILPSYLYNPVEWYAHRYDGLKERIWGISGPEDGPKEMEFPLRVLWISNFPPTAWIHGRGFRYGEIYVFYETYTTEEALGERLLDFGFQSFVLGDTAAKFHLQDEMKKLAARWDMNAEEWFTEGFRKHEEYIQSDSLALRSQALLRAKKYGEATSLLEQAVRLNPYSAHALGSLAFARQGQGQLLEAVKLWARVLEVCPNFFEAYWNLAQIHRSMGQNDMAIKAASRAVRFPEAKPGVFSFYEHLYRNLGRKKEADIIKIQRQIRKEELEPVD